MQVDIYDKLPVPFGLVRFGVAPDHPEVKVSNVGIFYLLFIFKWINFKKKSQKNVLLQNIVYF